VAGYCVYLGGDESTIEKRWNGGRRVEGHEADGTKREGSRPWLRKTVVAVRIAMEYRLGPEGATDLMELHEGRQKRLGGSRAYAMGE